MQNAQGYRGALSRASNASKESRASRVEESSGQRERPTNQTFTDQKARRNSQAPSSAVRQGEMQWHSAKKTREKALGDMQQAPDPKQVVMGNCSTTKMAG